MINTDQISERATDYFRRAFEESLPRIKKLIKEDGWLSMSMSVAVDGTDLAIGFSITPMKTKAEPEASTLDDENQGQLPIEGGGTVTIAAAGMEPVTVSTDQFQRAVRKGGQR
jgi:hypothetical protein